MTTNWNRFNTLAATRNTTVPDMIITFDASDTELAEIIRTDFGVDYISDSTIDDLTEEWDNDNNNAETASDYATWYDMDR